MINSLENQAFINHYDYKLYCECETFYFWNYNFGRIIQTWKSSIYLPQGANFLLLRLRIYFFAMNYAQSLSRFNRAYSEWEQWQGNAADDWAVSLQQGVSVSSRLSQYLRMMNFWESLNRFKIDKWYSYFTFRDIAKQLEEKSNVKMEDDSIDIFKQKIL